MNRKETALGLSLLAREAREARETWENDDTLPYAYVRGQGQHEGNGKGINRQD